MSQHSPDADPGDARRHREAKALRQVLDKQRRKQAREAREAMERWVAAPPPPVDDPDLTYKP